VPDLFVVCGGEKVKRWKEGGRGGVNRWLVVVVVVVAGGGVCACGWCASYARMGGAVPKHIVSIVPD
jgi:hypothetical protein